MTLTYCWLLRFTYIIKKNPIFTSYSSDAIEIFSSHTSDLESQKPEQFPYIRTLGLKGAGFFGEGHKSPTVFEAAIFMQIQQSAQ